MDRNRLIGARNQLPWRLPADMRRFRRVTLGKPILMGRKTHQSIGKALPERNNIVISRDPSFHAPGCTVTSSITAAIEACGVVDEVVVIGGASIYSQTLSRATHLYLTYIDHAFEGDEYFPEFEQSDWNEARREYFEADERNPYGYTFVDLERLNAR